MELNVLNDQAFPIIPCPTTWESLEYVKQAARPSTWKPGTCIRAELASLTAEEPNTLDLPSTGIRSQAWLQIVPPFSVGPVASAMWCSIGTLAEMLTRAVRNMLVTLAKIR